MSAVEKYYSVNELAVLWSYSEKTIIKRIKAKELGDNVVNLGTETHPDYRVPASAANAYLQARRIFSDDEFGIKARSVGELRRKAKV